jgi:hypothetical protein
LGLAEAVELEGDSQGLLLKAAVQLVEASAGVVTLVLRVGAWEEEEVLVLPRVALAVVNPDLWEALVVVVPNLDQGVVLNLALARDQGQGEYQAQAQKVLECSGHLSSPAVVGQHKADQHL